LAAVVSRDAPDATFHTDEGDDGYWCFSWQLEDRADRELFVEFPGLNIAPDILRVGIYFRDAPSATVAPRDRNVALEAVIARADVLAALGVACTFTPGDATRDDRAFSWQAADLAGWFTESCPNRDLVRRYDLRPGWPSVDQLASVVHELVPIWRTWNTLAG
jgi:hypothetical protein